MSGFGNNFAPSDWSSLSVDPAIVSFRQFPQFNNQQQQQQPQNPASSDLYMSQINQQGTDQFKTAIVQINLFSSFSGFGMNHNGMNMQNNLQSQTSPAQVSHYRKLYLIFSMKLQFCNIYFSGLSPFKSIE